MKLAFAIIILIHLLVLCCCNENSTNAEKELTSVPVLTAVGHTRNAEPSENYIPIKVMEMLKNTNGPIMLLGDLSYHTSQDSSVLEELSLYLNLKRKDVLFSPGNHDLSDRSILERYFSASFPQHYRNDSILYLTMDTEINEGNIIGEQFEKLKKILAENSDVTHIFIGTHQLIWLQDGDSYESIADSLINGYVGECSYCLRNNNFYEEVLPAVLAACPEAKITFIAGDVGHKVTHYITSYNDRVNFVAIGNNANKSYVTLQIDANDDGEFGVNVSVDI